MELLTCWDILDEHRRELLTQIARYIRLPDYYMAGGTALSLQMGLRKSVDFDFFIPDEFNPDDIAHQLAGISADITSLNVGRGTCDLIVEGVQVSFFHYPYKMLEPYVAAENVTLAGIRDIAAMKATAIGSRGAKKDFFDLYQILHQTDITVPSLVQDLHDKFGSDRDLSYIGMGLRYFDDAEPDPLTDLYVPFDWADAKKYFVRVSREFENEMRIKFYSNGKHLT